MTDRHHGYIVTLENEMREDDAEPTLQAIRQIKGVIAVSPIVANVNDFVSATRERNRLMQGIFEVFKIK